MCVRVRAPVCTQSRPWLNDPTPGFERWRDEVRRASAAARSAMKVVAAASVTVGGRRAGRCCLRAWDGWGRMS